MGMDDLQQFKQTYITECHELLQEMEERLLHLNTETSDLEELNAIFRCAHSIKGGAGAFGFDQITSFTHILEALLDAMREGQVHASQEIVDTLLKAADIVTQMVRAAQEGTSLPADFGKEVESELRTIASDGGVAAISTTHATNATPAATPEPASEDITIYGIHFLPHESIFSSGNEPLLIARELKTLGDLTTTIDTSKIPDLESIAHDICYLNWKFELETRKDTKEVEEVFEFVSDDCTLSIEIVGGYSIPTSTPAATAKNPVAETVSPTPAVAKQAPAPAQETADAAKNDNAAGNKSAGSTSIRVDVEKVDRLVNMVGELVITQAMLSAQVKHLPIDQFQGLIDGIIELSQHTRELQESVMSVRMQPVKSIFSRMPRIVRDLSKQLGKDIGIETFGENTEIDKTVIEQLSDPLMHMIRNSIDHGIEKPEERVKKGKPHQGTIKLSADHRGGRIVIEISDDGGGINREKVLARAKDKGLVPADATLTNEEIDNLVFMPGFSTAETVTNISGRGVGMDVVKRNINSLGGSVNIENRPDHGTTFSVSLPLTLAILDGMIVRSGNENYIVPIMSIIETMRPKPNEVQKLADGSDVINVRGEFVPVLYLYQCFQIKNAEADPSKALVILVENNRQHFGIVVDELVGQQQVVIKSLTENADPVQGISGATILGDGKVSLILDVGELHQILVRTTHERYKTQQKLHLYA